MVVQNTLLTTSSIFLLSLVGYGARRVGLLKAADSSIVSSLVLYITMPAFIFVNTHNKVLITDMVKAPVLGVAVQILVLALAYAAARVFRLDRRTTGSLMLVSVFGNTGFVGYPVVAAAFNGSEHAILTAVLYDEFAMALPLFTIGIAVATYFAGSEFEWRSLLEFLRIPLFPSMIVALILREVYIPTVIMTALDYLAAATVPLAMISIGLNLSVGSLKDHSGAVISAAALKMVAMPLLMFTFLPVIGVGGSVAQVVVLQSAMPSAVFSGVVAARFGANGAFAASAIFATTLLSIVWIPAVLMFIQ